MIKYIESIHNNIIKQTNALKQKKERDRTGLFIAEGERLVRDMSDMVKYVIVSRDFKEDISMYPVVYSVEGSIFSGISDTKNPQGIMAVCQKKEYDIEELFRKKDPFIVILEDTADPGNMGTIIRTCDAAAVDGVILSRGCVDIYNPKTVRSTMGSLAHIPVYTDEDIDIVLKKCVEHNILTVSAHLKGTDLPYNTDMTKGCAVIIGNEARGIKDSTAAMTQKLVRIPMPGKAESINAAAAASILVYEGVRQRRYSECQG